MYYSGVSRNLTTSKNYATCRASVNGSEGTGTPTFGVSLLFFANKMAQKDIAINLFLTSASCFFANEYW